jgi:translation initiation factor 3 subunit B
MGKGKKQNVEQQYYAELEEYLSESDDDNSREEEMLSTEDLQKSELAKAVLLDNLPITTKDKVDKLRSRLEQVLQQCDVKGKRFILDIPTKPEDGSTLGFAFASFDSEDAARTCLEIVNNYQFGSKNVVKVYPYSALDKYASLPDEMPPQSEPAYTEGMDLDQWLMDGREQFVIRQGLDTAVFWSDSLALSGETELVYGGERDKAQGKAWCKKQVMWSPRGRYLATFHDQGLVLWGGKEFERAGRYPHPYVTQAEFSPCERFVITYDDRVENGKNREALIVWNVRSQTKVKVFPDPEADWPIMRWSYDGSYFARAIENGISIFSTATMKLHDGKPVAAKDLASFEWSPSDNYVAYWCPEEGDVPARVVIFDPINKKEIRSKNLFNVSAVKLFWQNGGDFLCAQVTRHTKTKKTSFTNFEIFRMRDNACPNETLSMLETVGSFAFEPAPGFRFTIVHSDLPDGGVKAKMNVSIYSLGSVRGGAKLELVQTLENRSCQEVSWSPSGGVMVLASLDTTVNSPALGQQQSSFAGNGSLEFYDADAKHTLATGDHYMCNELRWDPSGRFLASIVTQPLFGSVAVRYTLENGYRLWSFQGTRLQDIPYQDFYQFLWRPRPKSQLTEEELEEVKKKLPSMMKRFEKEDAMMRKRRQASANAERVVQLKEFRTLMQERHRIFLENQQKRIAAGIIKPESEQESQDIVEKVEELISEKVDPLN